MNCHQISLFIYLGVNFMNTTFGELTQPFMKTTLLKKTSVLELIMFHETGGENPKKAFIVFSCVIYTKI